MKYILVLLSILSTLLFSETIKEPIMPKLKSLTLSAEKTHFIRKKDTFYKDYLPVIAPIKVMAIYSDGHSEEVTDLVTWNKTSKSIRFYYDDFRASEGNFTVSALLDNVVSNEITLKIVNETQKLLTTTVINNDKMFYPNRNAVIKFRLNNKPTADVKLKLRLNKSEGVKFSTNSPYGSLETELVFKPGHFNDDDVMTRSIDVHIIDFNPNNTSDYTLITETFESEDPKYNGYDPDDIVVHKNNKIKLIEPSLQQRRGAIRGVPIHFRVLSKVIGLKYELIDPPKGMNILRRSDLGEDQIGIIDGVDIEWDVPMDIEEKTYTITMKATDLEGNKGQISFDIKVPKTTIIPTKVKNNELIVTDKNSNLYGMKMKGHDGENISNVTLRSVAYADVWKKHIKKKNPEDIIKRTVFVIDNMPEALDVKMPAWMDTYAKRINLDMSSYKYRDGSSPSWEQSSRKAYNYEGTNGYVFHHKTYDKYGSDGSKVYMIILNKAQNRSK